MVTHSSTSTLIFLILLSYGTPCLVILYPVSQWVLLSMLHIPILSTSQMIEHCGLSKQHTVDLLLFILLHSKICAIGQTVISTELVI